jgi:lysophospholipase L1-like esterase
LISTAFLLAFAFQTLTVHDEIRGLYSFAFRGEPQPLVLKKTPEKLKTGQPVKVVCLGDSVTGIYYHTGGRRAYPEMLALALQMMYPKAEVTVVNAGISGNKTCDGLNRLQIDVLDHKPDLVTVMFGLNDLTVLEITDFRANLAEIIRRCRATGAEVMLCTPNSVITTSGRPVPKLVEYCNAIREVAAEQQAPLCDIYAAYESLRARDPLAWRLLLSDEIHPNMDGHKLNAETLGWAITGQEVSLEEVGPPQPALPKTLSLVKAGKPVRVLAMEPLDKLIAPALQAVLPEAKIEVRSWPTAGQSLAQIEAASKAVRNAPPDLVLIAVPAAVTPPAESPPEEAVRSHSWILNWSLSFGLQEWDVVGIAPSVFKVDLAPEEKAADAFSRKMLQAQHLNLVARQSNDLSPPDRILEDWLREQLTGK